MIHVVQQAETIQSISNRYGIPVNRLIQDNGLTNPNNLVTGQAIIIAHPKKTYTVKQGDTLVSIANTNNITLIQLLANNPFLSERNTVNPGEILVISYDTNGTIATNGLAIPFIGQSTLRKTLPYLTYLSVFNYRASIDGDITAFYDDTEIIRIVKEYRVAPLMHISTLTEQGVANIEVAYNILLNEDFQDKHIEKMLTILKSKGYYGVNYSLQNINATNLRLYEYFLKKISTRLNQEGYVLFVTINPNINYINSALTFEKVDYTNIGQTPQEIIFIKYAWSSNLSPPSPVTSIYDINIFIDYVNNFIPSNKITVGMPTIGYDWELPYISGFSRANSLTYNSAINLAIDVGATIQFDEISQTPFFEYEVKMNGKPIKHLVWFFDARTMDALLRLVSKYQLNGTGIWNIMIYNTQLWFLINTQHEIEKVLII